MGTLRLALWGAVGAVYDQHGCRSVETRNSGSLGSATS